MTNSQYIEKTLADVGRILVDTSTLMTNGFQQFVNKNKERLIASGKTIVVPKAVYTELIRHMELKNVEKSQLAMAGIELMAMNKNIFQIESTPITDEEIAHAFADAQLLSELTNHRQEYNQLLITNDRNLSSDAFGLNQQLSCKGRRVLVCYINWRGEMQCCDCARLFHKKEADPICDKIDLRQNHLENEAEDNEEWKFDWKSAVISFVGASITYGTYYWGREIWGKIRRQGDEHEQTCTYQTN